MTFLRIRQYFTDLLWTTGDVAIYFSYGWDDILDLLDYINIYSYVCVCVVSVYVCVSVFACVCVCMCMLRVC